MKEGFEGQLRAFSGDIKEENKLKEKSEIGDDKDVNSELNELSSVIDGHLKKAARIQHTEIGTQKEVYEAQKEKQRIMQRMKEDFACLYNPDCTLEKKIDERLATYNGSEFIYEDDKGQSWGATFGEIMTDMEWGVSYHLDKDSVPLHLMKQYILEKTKKKLADLLDRQIMFNEVESTTTHWMKREAYLSIYNRKESGESKERWGFVSEIIVKNFLKKMSTDFDLPFTIKDADVYQDVEQKIDFIIHREKRSRGVGVKSDEEAKDVGIQFTVNDSARSHKEEQIKRSLFQLKRKKSQVQDIALVVFPLDMAMNLKYQWEEVAGRPAGGPDRYLDRDTAYYLFSSLLHDVFEPDEIIEYWDKVKNNFYSMSEE